MYLLDTNHCSGAIIANANILRRIAEVENSLIPTCVIVQGELIDMAERSQRQEGNLVLVKCFLQGIYIYNVDPITADIYGSLKAATFAQFSPKEKSKRQKTKITELGFDENDLWIAAFRFATQSDHYLGRQRLSLPFNKPEHCRSNPGFETLRTIE